MCWCCKGCVWLTDQSTHDFWYLYRQNTIKSALQHNSVQATPHTTDFHIDDQRWIITSLRLIDLLKVYPDWLRCTMQVCVYVFLPTFFDRLTFKKWKKRFVCKWYVFSWEPSTLYCYVCISNFYSSCCTPTLVILYSISHQWSSSCRLRFHPAVEPTLSESFSLKHLL